MQTIIQHLDFPDRRRILIISDIHGHADGLRALLDRARYSREDFLIIAGDLIEKGTQSLQVIRLVMEMRRKGYPVYPLMGNVDAWRLASLQSGKADVWQEFLASALRAKAWWGGSLLHEMCAELGVDLKEQTDIFALVPVIQSRFSPEIAFLAGLPTILDTQRMIFVHAGIPHERLAELAGGDNHPYTKFDDFLGSGLSFQKTVVVGHWPAVLYSKTYPDFNPNHDRQRRILSIDGGCGVKREGQLNLLILPDWRAEDHSLLTWDDLPRITALEDQSPSPADLARFIRWSDHRVTLLREGAEMSRVLYHGEEIDVPSAFLFFQEGHLCCKDTTDYVLPVRKGDELLVILRLSCGCYVKKEGIAGWYFGRYNENEVIDP